ncbi:uncharacterized protein LY79DRAFT_131875 [Colletotrichum navitas]|uniref:Uncharacterized protein n=1 Tax=Colletotrichum navitas TaxID=681940 RepID=A0AAD8Q3T9_9PEZI|nr:uncharacterized protein LY79DRAFT_131875 [Colletotrichum navitas]KAK1594537.1 hypothetical protein LY79DRAFT_131875 [Colletotrichum navitas]
MRWASPSSGFGRPWRFLAHVASEGIRAIHAHSRFSLFLNNLKSPEEKGGGASETTLRSMRLERVRLEHPVPAPWMFLGRGAVSLEQFWFPVFGMGRRQCGVGSHNSREHVVAVYWAGAKEVIRILFLLLFLLLLFFLPLSLLSLFFFISHFFYFASPEVPRERRLGGVKLLYIYRVVYVRSGLVATNCCQWPSEALPRGHMRAGAEGEFSSEEHTHRCWCMQLRRSGGRDGLMEEWIWEVTREHVERE